MFSRKDQTIFAPGAAPSAKRAAPVAMAPSLISADIAVIGTLTTAGEIQVDGRVDGNVYCESLVIGATGRIYGEIYTSRVTIRGDFKGLIRARHVHLCPASGVEGEILYKTLVVEAGAHFAGNCRQCDDPLEETRKPARFHSDFIPAMAAAAE